MDVSSWLSIQGWTAIAQLTRYSGWALTLIGLLITIVGYYADNTARALKDEAKVGRLLEDEEASRLVADLRKWVGKQYWIIVQSNDYNAGSEQAVLGSQLDKIFAAAVWQKQQNGMSKNGNAIPLPVHQRVSDRGLEVGSASDDQSRALAEGVAKALRARSIRCTTMVYTDLINEFVLLTVAIR